MRWVIIEITISDDLDKFQIVMMQKGKQTFKKIDMFSTTELFRYKEETEYATCTGAILSLLIITVILLLVYQVLLHTINRSHVTWSQDTEKELIPSDLTMKLGEMKFGLAMSKQNFSDPKKSYVDVLLMARTGYSNGTSSSEYLSLEACKA